MAEPIPLSPQEEQLVRQIGRLVHGLPRFLEDDMAGAAGIAMTDFAVLIVLAEAPGQRLRMADLAWQVGLTPSRITRVVDGLRTRDLVTKGRDPGDARSNVAALTATGRIAAREAQPHYVASVRHRILTHIPPETMAATIEGISRVTDALLSDYGPRRERGLTQESGHRSDPDPDGAGERSPRGDEVLPRRGQGGRGRAVPVPSGSDDQVGRC
ncbi:MULTISPECIES: MarR family winged helix-turn-helix transcriptional regulator [Frankia]|uniref:Bacterial regulatory protein, MarR (Partial) n=1 Tax=Frankia alni (strain DSM 45986 / CECT 9034 / ACN14a) TaxID=326424 RepID=Q0RMK6_FRAAA|nr:MULTISPECIES: MarR family winged helix-turn-helix transcriptional regulator [Frankia]CAJ61244.1 Putative bacterial regulatory protein, MarR (partial) [Frankia alni ACN14a]